MPIGNGGMGTVWRSTDTLLRRDVAVKEVILPPTMPQSEKESLCERTLREARAAAALSHPSVVQVYDVVTDAGRPWIVMELLEARSLADMVIDDGPLPARAVAKIGIAMLGALEVAHAAGVLHRDVKPANVLICTDGRCVLTDFGVARLPTESNLTTPGMVLGSPHFISPERAVGGPFGPPSDLFSLGVTLYTAVEGGPPFDRGDPFETMRAVVEEAPRPPRLAGPLEPVLWGLLEKEPSLRWSVDQARAVLRELLAGPLSRSGQAHAQHDTDPHAVVRPVSGPPPAIRNQAQVGGRAMLDPAESLTGHLARLRGVSDSWHADPEPPMPPAGPHVPPAGPHVPPPHQRRPHRSAGPVAPVNGPRPLPVPLPGTDDWYPAQPRREGVGRRRAKSSSAMQASRIMAQVKTLVREAGNPAHRMRVAIGAGFVVLLTVVAVATAAGWFSGAGTAGTPPDKPAAPGGSPPADTPLIEVQGYSDERGIAVNVPKEWERSSGGSYVDFHDPEAGQEGERKVRINIENTSTTARRFLQGAESGLKNPSRCPAPYARVRLADAELAGTAGAELEYTCGEGEGMRHGIWRAIIVDGKAYHFYLTVPDSRFAESKVIFDEMVRSFRFT
jgi:serine/threonine protein kinase